MAGQRLIIIQHGANYYPLQIATAGKLILTE
jgi:hemin uptake protein HemP